MKKVKSMELWRAKATCDIGIERLQAQSLFRDMNDSEQALYLLLQAVKDIALHLEKGEK